MDTTSIAHHHALFTLTRVHPDGTEEIVETATDHTTAIEAGHRMMHLHPGAAFSLYAGERRVAKFAHHTLALRLRVQAVAMMAG